MTAASTTAGSAVATPPLFSRIYGLGSVFGKTLRDSRRAILLAALMLFGIFIGVTGAIAAQFNTVESRLEMEALIRALPPILQGLAGPVVNVGTMGGYLQYKYGTFFPVILSLWSILALSGTLAAEARRGSLEFVLSGPQTRRRIALEKLSGHLTGLAVTFVVSFVAIAVAGAAFGSLPGDAITVTQAFGYAIWMVLMALAAGSVAFALSPLIGRGGAAGIAGFVTIAGFLVTGYSAPVPQLGPVASLTWFGWTYNHLPLAGEFDWLSVASLAMFDIVMLTIGVTAFVRRDVGDTSAIPSPALPRVLVGMRNPFTRSIGHNLSAAVAWGLGVGVFGLVIAASAQSFVAQLGNSPEFMRLLAQFAPGLDFGTIGGFLQLLFVEFAIIMIGFAATTLVSGWASEETSGRLEMVLSGPVSRVRWALGATGGVIVDMLVVSVLIALGIAVGGAMSGGDVVAPIVGSAVFFVYGATLIGIGVAVGGLFGARLAAPVTALVVLLTWFLELFGNILDLPDAVKQLALTRHYGETMIGVWDWTGIGFSLSIAIVGIGLGALGLKRRDLRS
jgi:ABC-2 type transport system permease protein